MPPQVPADDSPQEEGDDSERAKSTDALLHSNGGRLRSQLEHGFNTNKFQIGVMCLVIIDCLLVISELLIDLNISAAAPQAAPQTPGYTVGNSGGKNNATAPPRKLEGSSADGMTTLYSVVTALHYCSIVIVAAFVIEICTKAAVYGKRLVNHKMEIVDGVIVVVTFSLEVALADGTGAISGVGLLIALRLWRVTKILNGIVLSVKKQSDRQLSKEKLWRLAMDEELTRLTDRCAAQECEIEALRTLLLKNGVDVPPKDPSVQPQKMGDSIDVSGDDDGKAGEVAA